MIIDILLVILIAAASLLCVYLIFTLIKVNRNISLFRRDVEDIKNKLFPILDNLQKITDKAAEVSSSAEEKIKNFTHTINSLKKILSSFVSPVSGSNDPQIRINTFIRNLSAISKGISAFISRLRKK